MLPGPAETTASRTDPSTTFRLPVGPYAAGILPTQQTEGALEQTAWKIAAPGLSTLELITPLRAQLTDAGFSALYECETEACGGFDFRFGTDVLPEPDMHVDLGDFRYLAAERSGPSGPEFVALLVSRSAHDGFVQVTQIGKGLRPAPLLTTSTKSPFVAPAPDQSAFTLPAPPPGTTVESAANLGKRLELGQPEVLEDLVFAPGKAELAAGDFASLAALAGWLTADPARQVTLVGHTDASGALAGNIRLSKARAESVRAYLINRLGVGSGQVQAEGVGYLAPRASNQTDEGRQKNRRVEVISTSTKLLAP
jgi:OOP family OmpA-OmpF porin